MVFACGHERVTWLGFFSMPRTSVVLLKDPSDSILRILLRASDCCDNVFTQPACVSADNDTILTCTLHMRKTRRQDILFITIILYSCTLFLLRIEKNTI